MVNIVKNEQNSKVVGHAHYIYQSNNADYMRYYIDHLLDVKSRIIPLSPEDQRYDEDDPFLLDSALLSLTYAGIHNKKELSDMYQGIFRKESEIRMDLFENTYEWLIKHGFIDPTSGRVTTLGEKTCKFAVKPRTALHFVQLRAILNAYKGEVNYPTLFALTLMTEEFTDNIRVNPNESVDALAIRVGSGYINDTKVLEIIGDNDYLRDIFLPRYGHICKAFCMTYHLYLEEIGVLSRDERSQNRIPCNASDTGTIRSSAERIMNAGFRILGTYWKYGEHLKLMFQGILSEVPSFDPAVLELGSLEGCGLKTVQTLIALNINNLTKLSVINPDKLTEASKKLRVEGKGITIGAKKASDLKQQAKIALINQERGKNTHDDSDIPLDLPTNHEENEDENEKNKEDDN